MRKNTILIGLIFLIFIGFTFYRLPGGFFQQDEWATFGVMNILRQDFSRIAEIIFPKSLFYHFAPTSFFLDYGQYRLFNLSFPPYTFVSLTFHFINSILVYYFFRLLTQKRILSLMGGLIFATNSFSHQATTWISTSTSTQGATLFALTALILFFRYLKSQPQRTTFLILSLFSFFISLTFKESSIFLLVFLPIFCLIFGGKKRITSLKKLSLFLFILIIFYLGLRFFLLLYASPLPPTEAKAMFQPSKATYLYRLFALPLRAIPQSLLSRGLVISWAEKLVFLAYPHYFVASDGAVNPYVVESVAFDLICYFLVIFILWPSYLLYCHLKRIGEKGLVRGLLLSLTLIAASSLSFIFIPGKAGYSSIFEPRNLYLVNIGSSLFLAVSILAIADWLKKKTRTSASFWVLLISIPILLVHIKNIRSDISQLVLDGQLRKSILTQIKTSYPKLPKKVIFYTESDSPFYGLPDEEKILPFQSGFGQTLLAWYYESEKFPPCLYKDLFLYEIESQGYKDCQGRGFGYFREFPDLEAALRRKSLKPEDVIGFSFSEKGNRLLDITPRIRSDLKRVKGVD